MEILFNITSLKITFFLSLTALEIVFPILIAAVLGQKKSRQAMQHPFVFDVWSHKPFDISVD